MVIVKIHWMKEPAQDKPVQIKPKTALIDSNKMKLMGYMLQMFQVKEKDYSATNLLKTSTPQTKRRRRSLTCLPSHPAKKRPVSEKWNENANASPLSATSIIMSVLRIILTPASSKNKSAPKFK